MAAKIKDLTGQKFGLLTVVRLASVDAGDVIPTYKGTFWLARCECGGEMIAGGQSMRRGETKSCGCLQKRHAQELSKIGMDARAKKRAEKLNVAKTEIVKLEVKKPKITKTNEDDKVIIKVDKSKASIKQRLDMRGFNREMANIEKSLYAWD